MHRKPLVTRKHYVDNRHGWELELRQAFDPERLRKDLRPLVIVPGYGMNAYIFGFHPRGDSMEACWAYQGFEVWSVNLRGQGGSRRRGGARNFNLTHIVTEDLPAAIEGVLANTATQVRAVDAVGCSLGGTYFYAYLALHDDHKVNSVVAMGAPLRWEVVHPALRLAFSQPELLGRIRMRGTQALARTIFPLLTRVPGLLEIYLHPEIVEMRALADLTRTIEDPVPGINRQIGYWMRHRDLVLNNVNITRKLAARTNPLLCVIANGDGIVPRETALSGLRAMGSRVREVLEVGDDSQAYAHADLFVSNHAKEHVFDPIASWLFRQYDPVHA